MKSSKLFWISLMFIGNLYMLSSCKTVNIIPPKSHPSQALEKAEEPHLNLLSDEDRATYLEVNNKKENKK